MQLFRIGRAPDSECHLTDQTVSRRHAELIKTSNGRFFIVDCASSSGTQIAADGQWQSVRQAYVSADQAIKFGAVETTPRQMTQR